MNRFSMLLLTSGTDDLLGRVSDNFTDLQARVMDLPDMLALQPDGQVWMFIDWLLPVMAGVQLVRVIRSLPWGKRARIAMVLPSDDEALRSRALAEGADDYVVGPLTADALVDRLRVYDGGVSAEPTPPLSVGELKLEPDGFCARYKGRLVPLSLNEFRLMTHFARNPNKVYSRKDLVALLGKASEVEHLRTVDVWMSRLRATLQCFNVPYIPRTVRSLGYVLDVEREALPA